MPETAAVPETMARLLRVSAFGIFQFFVATTSFTGLVRVITPYSSTALAGYTIAVRVIIFVLLPAWGLCNAATAWPLGWGPTGVFVAIPVAEAAAALTAIVLFRRGHWKGKVL